ncbi:hypothetical protein SAMN05421810_10442 [Amycolatopsis arida]|uniref:Uncharacterized protein n=1 Tax=Amycolatopsis arida TaxID=587909 RepID=A0A1I5UN74_9PSEU|nr:hypothetical protein [Amycolatopsis arida]TDX90964.1 hypothetical protein CLV69_10641 [Amycolatopsis arida]SFP96695.1 hypothetical protein SAMN05421810_10442 [Amycolatopsis arida]
MDWSITLHAVPLLVDGQPATCEVTVSGLRVGDPPTEFRTVAADPYVSALSELLGLR